MLKTITIIPNDSILNVPVYHNESKILDHAKLVDGFYTKYYLPKNKKFSGQELLLPQGHIIIASWDDFDFVTCWINLNLTDKQYEALLSLKDSFLQYNYFETRSFTDYEFYISEVPEGYKGTIVDYFYEELEKVRLERKGRK